MAYIQQFGLTKKNLYKWPQNSKTMTPNFQSISTFEFVKSWYQGGNLIKQLSRRYFWKEKEKRHDSGGKVTNDEILINRSINISNCNEKWLTYDTRDWLRKIFTSDPKTSKTLTPNFQSISTLKFVNSRYYGENLLGTNATKIFLKSERESTFRCGVKSEWNRDVRRVSSLDFDKYTEKFQTRCGSCCSFLCIMY